MLIATEVPLTMSLRIVAILLAVSFFLIVVDLIRRRKLLEKYAITWFVLSLAVILIALVPPILGTITDFLNIAEPTNALFFIAIVFILSFLLRVTVHISSLNERLTRLNQEVSILKKEISKSRNRKI